MPDASPTTRPLRVLHVIPSLSPRRGGPTDALLGVAPFLADLGIESTIVTTNDDVQHRSAVPLEVPVDFPGCRTIFFDRHAGWTHALQNFSFSPALVHWLEDHIDKFDLVHAHALFSHAPSAAMQLCQKRGIPYICRPLGLLGAWPLKQKRLRKALFFGMVDRGNLDHADALEYSSPEEAQEALELDLTTPTKVIPLGFKPIPIIDNARARMAGKWGLNPAMPVLLFFSRIDPKKGLDILFDALAHPDASGIQLAVAGSGDADYERFLRRRANELNLEDRLHWLGFLSGEDKDTVLRGADLFVLPSHSESFGIAVAEAMSAELPVVTTPGVPLSKVVEEANAGWVVPPKAEAIRDAIFKALADPETAKSMGRRGAEVAVGGLSYQATSTQLAALYRQVIADRAKPDGAKSCISGKVLHVIPSLSKVHGGPSVALPLMAKALHSKGFHVETATTDDDGPGRHLQNIPLGTPVSTSCQTIHYFKKQSELYKTSLPLARWLFRHIDDHLLVHVHAVFSFSSLAAAWIAYLHNVPFIIRPLGTLNRWGMTARRPWLKRLSFALLERPLINAAAAIHFTSRQEANEATRLNLKCPSVILPIGVDMSAWETPVGPEDFEASFPSSINRPVVLFLSRIDPKKGIEFLLSCFAQLLSKSPKTTRPLLVVAGDGDRRYSEKLLHISASQGIQDDVLWTGRIEGTLKHSAFSKASVFVLPSYSENFGIALLEAMASGKACISSPEVALADDVCDTGAIRVLPHETDRWVGEIQTLLNDPSERQRLGCLAREVAHRRYSLEAMGLGLKAMYQSILNQDNTSR